MKTRDPRADPSVLAAFGRALHACIVPFVRFLDGLDVVCGWLKRLAIRMVFRGGESPARKLARLLRRLAATCADRWAEPFFRPDETIVPDPLRPSARVVAAGFSQAGSGSLKLMSVRGVSPSETLSSDRTRTGSPRAGAGFDFM